MRRELLLSLFLSATSIVIGDIVLYEDLTEVTYEDNSQVQYE